MSANMINSDCESRTDESEAVSDSSAEKKSRKVKTTCDAPDQPKNKIRKTSTKSDSQQKNTKVASIGTGPSHGTGGLKHMQHGVMYQFKVIMLFILRALKQACAFRIGTEVTAAGKLDDIVFSYDKDCVAFFQVKHRLDQTIKIKEKDLLYYKREFCIKKYYNSYQKILNDKELEDVSKGRNMIFIMYTNIGIDESIAESFECVADSSILKENKILALATEDERNNYYIIKEQSELYRKLFKTLRRSERNKYKNVIGQKDKDDDQMRTFLKTFVFAVKQSNEEELGDVCKKEISKIVYDDQDSIASKFESYIQDWSKQKKGRYLTNLDIEQQLAVWSHDSLNQNRKMNIKKYNCTFKKTNVVIENLSNFLNTTNDAPTKYDVLCLYCTETLFSKIKVCQALETFSEKNAGQQFIFCDIGDLIESEKRKKFPVKAFSSQTCNTLFVSLQDCELNDAEERIIIRLLKIITESYNVEKSPSNKQRKRLIMAIPENVKTKFANNNFFNNQEVKIQHLDDLSNSFEDLDDESKQHIRKNCSIKIHGKQVTDLFSENELDPYIKDEILLKLLTNELEINEAIAEQNLYNKVKSYYVHRSLLPIIVDQRIEVDSQFYIVREHTPQEDIGNKEVVVISSDETVFDDFRKTCTNVHWLQEINERYVWMNSKGILTNLNDVVNDIVLISADPGMGKSILLSHVADQSKNEDDSFIVFKINLTSTIEKLDSLNAEKNVALEQAIHFLFISTQIESSEIEKSESAFDLLTLPINKDGSVAFSPHARLGPLEHLRAMVFCHLYNKEKIVLLLDGFDEIAPEYCETTLNLLLALKQSKVRKMWITTRPYAITKNLERYLETFEYKLKPLSENEQLKFFENYYSYKHNIEARYVETHLSPKDFLKSLDMSTFSIIHETGRNFLSVPLHCYMVAKVFNIDFKKYCSQNFADAPAVTSISICDLYSKFFDIKFNEILYSEVNLKNPKNAVLRKKKEMVERDLGKLALLVMFQENIPSELVSDEERITLINKIKSGKEKTGIVIEVVGNIPRFVHRTFAEYFAAHYLARVLMSDKENETKKEAAKSLLYENLTTENYQVLFTFFNSIVASHCKNKDIFEAAIHGNIEKLSETENVNDIFDSLKRTPMHLIASNLLNVLDKFLRLYLEADLETAATMYNYFNIFIQRLNQSMSKRSPDALFTWTPAHYLTISYLRRQNRVKLIDIPFLFNYFSDVTPDYSHRTPFLLLIFRSPYILDRIKNYALSNRIDVNAQDKFGETALHYILKILFYFQSLINYVCFLIQLGARIDIPDKTGTALEDHINQLSESCFFGGWHYETVDLPLCNVDNIFKKSWKHINKHVKEYLCASEELDDLPVLISSATFNKTEPRSAKNELKKLLFHQLNIQNNTPILPVPNSQVIALYCMDANLRENGDEEEKQKLVAKTDIFTMSTINDDEIIFLLIETKYVASILLSKFPHLVNVVDSRGRSALHYALYNGDISKVTLLIKSNARVDIPDSAGKIPAFIEKSNVLLECDTFDKRKLNFVDLLPFIVAEPLVLTMNLYPIQSETDTDFIIHILLHTGTIANVLLSHYPNAVDTKDSKGRTALHYAVEKNNLRAVCYLIDKNAQVNITDNEGKCPAHLTNDKLAFIDRLPFVRAKPLVLTMGLISLVTPFETDTLKNILDKHLTIASILWAEHSDLLVKHNCIYFDSLHVSNEIVSRLLNIYCIKDFSVNILKSNEVLQLVTELLSSVQSNDLSRVQTVLKRVETYNSGKYKTLTRKVNFSKKLVFYLDFTPAWLKFKKKFSGLRSSISILCDETNVAISMVNARSDKDGGKTALHYAAEIGNADIVEALLSHGAYYNVPDFHGSTPSQIAETRSHSAVVHLLETVEKLFNSLNDELFQTGASDFSGSDLLREIFIQNYEPETIEDEFVGIQNLGIEFEDISSDDESSLIMKIHNALMNKG